MTDDSPFDLALGPAARRALAADLSESVAAAIIEFITGALIERPRVVGKPLHEPLRPADAGEVALRDVQETKRSHGPSRRKRSEARLRRAKARGPWRRSTATARRSVGDVDRGRTPSGDCDRGWSGAPGAPPRQ